MVFLLSMKINSVHMLLRISDCSCDGSNTQLKTSPWLASYNITGSNVTPNSRIVGVMCTTVNIGFINFHGFRNPFCISVNQWLWVPSIRYYWQGQLNSLKVVGAQLTNKTHFYCEKLNSYEHLQILWGQMPPVPPGFAAYDYWHWRLHYWFSNVV